MKGQSIHRPACQMVDLGDGRSPKFADCLTALNLHLTALAMTTLALVVLDGTALDCTAYMTIAVENIWDNETSLMWSVPVAGSEEKMSSQQSGACRFLGWACEFEIYMPNGHVESENICSEQTVGAAGQVDIFHPVSLWEASSRISHCSLLIGTIQYYTSQLCFSIITHLVNLEETWDKLAQKAC